MPTPLSASKKDIKYVRIGGGIDILARIKHKDNNVRLCVMELKDENITALREKGVWTAYSDRLALFSNFYRINEHSAQQDSKRLRNL